MGYMQASLCASQFIDRETMTIVGATNSELTASEVGGFWTGIADRSNWIDLKLYWADRSVSIRVTIVLRLHVYQSDTIRALEMDIWIVTEHNGRLLRTSRSSFYWPTATGQKLLKGLASSKLQWKSSAINQHHWVPFFLFKIFGTLRKWNKDNTDRSSFKVRLCAIRESNTWTNLMNQQENLEKVVVSRWQRPLSLSHQCRTFDLFTVRKSLFFCTVENKILLMEIQSYLVIPDWCVTSQMR